MGGRRTIKCMPDGRAMLNVGCGPRTHLAFNNLDFSPYALLGSHRGLVKVLYGLGLLSANRYESLRAIDPDIIYWNVRRGLPFADRGFDLVYHSHFITHLDREDALEVTHECWRVLKPGGIVRVVVPDLRQLVLDYDWAFGRLESGESAFEEHQRAVDELFELMVRRVPVGTSRQHPLVRVLEMGLRGDIHARGESRRWQYDRFSMAALLRQAGFRKTELTTPDRSLVEGWNAFGLDLNPDGSVYKPGSLFMEGIK
ncbi:MAG: methyltransferase domain-containing protein [Magnetococcales bacterium]|nr:methyltransferase domain-containing protein [Magnetococcales bacterium]